MEIFLFEFETDRDEINDVCVSVCLKLVVWMALKKWSKWYTFRMLTKVVTGLYLRVSKSTW